MEDPLGTIVGAAQDAGSFATLLAAPDVAGLTAALDGDSPFTVFAPTEEASSAIPADDLTALLADPSALAAVFTYHLPPGALQGKGCPRTVDPAHCQRRSGNHLHRQRRGSSN